MKNSKLKRSAYLISGALLLAITVPSVGSAASLANLPFAVKAVNAEKPTQIFAIKPFLKGGTGGGSATPTPTPTGGTTSPTPAPTGGASSGPTPGSSSSPSPTAPPVTTAPTAPAVRDLQTTMLINPSAPGCTPSRFYLNINSGDTNGPSVATNAYANWGDGLSSTDLTQSANFHSYATGKKYTLSVVGTLGGFSGMDATSVSCIEQVTHFGQDSGITSLRTMFQSAPNVTYVAAPPKSVTEASYMFNASPSFNGDTSDWRLPNLKTATAMFSAVKFNGDLSKLGADNLIDASNMFYNAKAFEQDVSGWNVSKVNSLYTNFGLNSPLAAHPERMPPKFRPAT